MISGIMQKKIEKLEAILSIQDVAVFFSIHSLTVHRMIRRGELPAYKDEEGHWCILRADIKKYCSKASNI